MTLKHYNSNNSSTQMESLEDKEEKYRILVMALEKRCSEIKRSNEALAARSITIRKLIKKRSKDVEILKARLDKFGDSWRFV